MVFSTRWKRPFGRLARMIGAIALASATGAFIAGCNHSNSTPADLSGPPGGVGFDSVMATVNGDPITYGEHYDALNHFVPAAISGYPQNPILAQPAGGIALQNLIVNKLTLQIAKQSGVAVRQSDIDAFYNDNKMTKEAQQTQTFEDEIKAQGYTVDQYKQEVLAPQVAQMNLLAKSVTITPAELQDAYSGNSSQYTLPARVHIHRIAAATKEDAQAVYKDIKSGRPLASLTHFNIAADGSGGNPDDATDIAQWINIDQPSPALGPIGPKLKNAKPNDVLPPIRVQNSWWVIQVTEAKPREALPFDKVQDMVRINVIRQKSGQNALMQFQSTLMSAMQHAVIEIKPPQYQSIAQEMHAAALTQGMPSAPPPSAPTKKP